MKKVIQAALLTVACSAAASTPSGTVCIAPVTAEMRTMDVGAAPGDRPLVLKYDFYVGIDSRTKVPVSEKVGVLVKSLNNSKHTVRIWDGSKQIESFFFTFRQQGSNHLCLWFTPFYRSWSLGFPDGRPGCRCH